MTQTLIASTRLETSDASAEMDGPEMESRAKMSRNAALVLILAALTETARKPMDHIHARAMPDTIRLPTKIPEQPRAKILTSVRETTRLIVEIDWTQNVERAKTKKALKPTLMDIPVFVTQDTGRIQIITTNAVTSTSAPITTADARLITHQQIAAVTFLVRTFAFAIPDFSTMPRRRRAKISMTARATHAVLLAKRAPMLEQIYSHAPARMDIPRRTKHPDALTLMSALMELHLAQLITKESAEILLADMTATVMTDSSGTPRLDDVRILTSAPPANRSVVNLLYVTTNQA